MELWDTAEAVERESIRQQLLAQREQFIVEVEKSLENLGQVLGSVKKASVHAGDGLALDELREELNARLRIAEEVEQRMVSMRRGHTPTSDEETYLRHAE